MHIKNYIKMMCLQKFSDQSFRRYSDCKVFESLKCKKKDTWKSPKLSQLASQLSIIWKRVNIFICIYMSEFKMR